MKRGRRSSGLSISLFPFLAVLVCTMGGLILLLLAINEQASMEDPEPPPPLRLDLTEFEEELEKLTIRWGDSAPEIQQLQSQMDQLQARLESEGQKVLLANREVDQLVKDLQQAKTSQPELLKRLALEKEKLNQEL